MREGWIETTLEQVAEVNPRVAGVDSESRFITMADVDEWGRWARTSGPRANRGGAKAIGGDVLVARITPCLENGKIAQVPHEWGPVGGSTEFLVVRARSQVLPDYLYYWAQEPQTHLRSTRRMIGTSGRKRVSAGDYEQLPFLLPPIEEQRRIVDLMSHMDAVVQATRGAHTAGLESYSALSKPLPLRAGQPRSLEEVLLSARAGGTPSRSRSDFYGGGIPWVKSGEVRGTVVRTQESLTPAGVNGSSAWVVPAGRVLVAMYGATAGQVGMLGIDAATNQAVLALEADPNLIHPRYLYHMLRGDTARLKVAASGAAQPNLSKTTIIQRSYPIPLLNEQTTIAEVLDGIEEQVERERITLEGLNTLRQVTLSALVSGEHAIPTSYDEFIRDEGAA